VRHSTEPREQCSLVWSRGRNDVDGGFHRAPVYVSAHANGTGLFTDQRADAIDDGQFCDGGIVDGPVGLRRELVPAKSKRLNRCVSPTSMFMRIGDRDSSLGEACEVFEDKLGA
jgi:hypothetical protein